MRFRTNLLNISKKDAEKIVREGLLDTEVVSFCGTERDHRHNILIAHIDYDFLKELYKKEDSVDLYLSDLEFEYNGEKIKLRSDDIAETEEHFYYNKIYGTEEN